MSDCKNCGKGKYNDDFALQAETDCKDCAAGKYNDATGSLAESACINCVAQKFSATVASSTNNCEACPGGQHQADIGQTNCNNNQCTCRTTGGTAAFGANADVKLACPTHAAEKCQTIHMYINKW